MEPVACQKCEQFWSAYEHAVFEHVRLNNRLRIAEAAADASAIAQLQGEVEAAEAHRSVARKAHVDHEREAGHGEAHA